MTRRDFVKQAAVGATFAPVIGAAQQPAAVKTKEAVKPLPVHVGMTD
jgi:hypothetical protein